MKLLVSDFDGTFFLEGVEKDLKAIEDWRKVGNLFVIATGRSYYDYKIKEQKYKIPTDFIILNHGATILYKDEIIYNKTIDDNIVKEITKIKVKEVYCCRFKESRTSINNKDITKIVLKFDNEKETEIIKNKLMKKYNNDLNVYLLSNKKTLEIVSKNANKYFAIEFLKKKINFQEIIVIGNGKTDVEMIKNYDGYCVSNSCLDVKEVCKKEYSSVYELINDKI